MGTSLPDLCNSCVSEPPPIHFPLMNTRGTERAPVNWCRYCCKASQSSNREEKRGREGEGVRKGGKEGEGVREGGKEGGREGGGKREREKLDLILFTQSSIHTDKHFNINTREGNRTNTQQHIISKNSHKLHTHRLSLNSKQKE